MSKKIKVRIYQVNNPKIWYADKIGQILEVEQSVLNPNMYSYGGEAYISKSDCEIVATDERQSYQESEIKYKLDRIDFLCQELGSPIKTIPISQLIDEITEIKEYILSVFTQQRHAQNTPVETSPKPIEDNKNAQQELKEKRQDLTYILNSLEGCQIF